MRVAKIIAIVSILLTLAWGITNYTISTKIKSRRKVCLQQLAVQLEAKVSPDTIVQQDLAKLQGLVEQSLTVRSQIIRIAQRLRKDTGPLHPRDLVTLKGGTEYYLALRSDLYALIEKYECAIDVEMKTLNQYKIAPALRLKALMVSLGAALTLYDNYMLAIVFFEHDSRLRQLLNDPDKGFNVLSNKLAEVTLSASSLESRKRIALAIKFYESQKSVIGNLREDSDLAYLIHLIDHSPSYNYVKKIRLGDIANKKITSFEHLTTDQVAEMSKDGFDFLSKVFGNTVGIVETRKGKLYTNPDALQKIKSTLQPLDILLEKTPFRLTDKLIPGHFGHVAIWTGTKAELITAGVWEHPNVQSYHNYINDPNDPHAKDKSQVIEALRDGVQLNTLAHFLNVDDVAVLRPVFPAAKHQELRQEALQLAFRQVGKQYDFNFDVNTTEKIVCSELAYVSFPSIQWPTQKTIGRHSISPDHVAEVALRSEQLEIVLFYHDGKLVDPSQQVQKMRSLLQAK